MSNKEFEQQLQRSVARLTKEMQPQRDLWPGIEHALNHEQDSQPKSNRRAFQSMAAAFLIIGLFGWLGFNQMQEGDRTGQLVAVLSEPYQQQKQRLLASYADQPALTDNWQQQVQELDDAAAAIKLALKEDPDNPALLKMLKQVYQQQIDLIERVHAPAWQTI